MAVRSTSSLGGNKDAVPRFTPTVLVISAVYSVAGVLAFVLFSGPFSRDGRWSWVTVFTACVVTPYIMLYAAYRILPTTSKIVTGSVVISGLLAAIAYSLSFASNDGEYAVVYYVVPLIQLPLALIALAVAIVTRRRATRDAIAT